jgi:hypothetical protein
LVRREQLGASQWATAHLTVVWDQDLDTARVTDDGTVGPVDVLDAMWFAWHAFHLDTEVLR